MSLGTCRGAAVLTGRWLSPQLAFGFYICVVVVFRIVEAWLILAAIIINSQKKVQNIDIILQTSCITS